MYLLLKLSLDEKEYLGTEHTCDYCQYKSTHAWVVRRHMVKKHVSVSVPPVRRNHYGAAGSLPKKVETVERDKKLLEESQEVLKI